MPGGVACRSYLFTLTMAVRLDHASPFAGSLEARTGEVDVSNAVAEVAPNSQFVLNMRLLTNESSNKVFIVSYAGS